MRSIVLRAGQFGSPTSALRAVRAAAQDLDGVGMLLVALAGHVAHFERTTGDLVSLVLPNSVPGRPGSMLPMADLIAELHGYDATGSVVICADLTTAPSGSVPLSPIPGVHLLASIPGPTVAVGRTCHDALAAELGDLAASGELRPLNEVLHRAADRARASGVAVHVSALDRPIVLSAKYPEEQLPDYVREDLYSPHAGSRLDAVTELAALAPSSAHARVCLQRVATHDSADEVRSYAESMSRQAEQPTLQELLDNGRISATGISDALHRPALPDFVPHSGGEVVIGLDPPDSRFSSCRPRHLLRLPPFELARTVVTNSQYLAFVAVAGGPCPEHWATGDNLWDEPSLPVVMVSWHDAVRYCDWLTRRLRAVGRLTADQRVVLPSEAEWEYAASNGRGDPYPWGSAADPRGRRTNIRATGLDVVVAPGRFSPQGDSAAGCQDLIGNVSEWTRSRWGTSGRLPTFHYPYQADDGREANGPLPDARYVIRGGAYYYGRECANSYTRNQRLATQRHPATGFRVAVVRRTG
ncbi:formylglycine-generating enzyme family protein [Micromonospora sp. Llam0]|uniref:formylglycine-generating enzyme family protein n=1 Tax=Micromonospora sp. Llam0 TaxID=2485143 RepID=UPI001315612D|nr:formylglycine-generating enzyme family protein [Micromonospora sp. Llam0]